MVRVVKKGIYVIALALLFAVIVSGIAEGAGECPQGYEKESGWCRLCPQNPQPIPPVIQATFDSVKKEAMSVWDQLWFKKLFTTTLGLLSDTPAFTYLQAYPDIKKMAQQLIQNASFDTCLYFEPGSLKASGMRAYYSDKLGINYVSKNFLSQAAFSSGLYSSFAARVLVHEAIHGIISYLYLNMVKDPKTGGYKYTPYDFAHCVTYALMLGISTGDSFVCDKEKIQAAYEYLQMDDEVLSDEASSGNVQTILNMDGDCQDNAYDDDDDNDGLADIEEENIGTNPYFKDTDADGWNDYYVLDKLCDVPFGRDAFPLEPDEWKDTDCDGIGDNTDPDPARKDADGDMVLDPDDDCPLNPCGSVDSDWDGLCAYKEQYFLYLYECGVYSASGSSCEHNMPKASYPPCTATDLDDSKTDTDGDGVPDSIDMDNTDSANKLTDTDHDGVADTNDGDIDGDGLANGDDPFPHLNDADGDYVPDGADDDLYDPRPKMDSDGDGLYDNFEYKAGTDSKTANKDGDHYCLLYVATGQSCPAGYIKSCDDDIDIWPDDPAKCLDFDGDGIEDSVDIDRDGDGVCEIDTTGIDTSPIFCAAGWIDKFPYDPNDWSDDDGDGLGNHFETTIGTDPADDDSDNDGLKDGEEVTAIFFANKEKSITHYSDPNNPKSICKECDFESDKEAKDYIDSVCVWGYSPACSHVDTDGDKMADAYDYDDDNDGWGDAWETGVSGTDPLKADADNDCHDDKLDNCPKNSNKDQQDNDVDGIGDMCDDDDDNDGVVDDEDCNPLSSIEGNEEKCGDKLDNNCNGKVDEGCLGCKSPGGTKFTYKFGECYAVADYVNKKLMAEQCSSLIKGPPGEVVGCWEGCSAQYPCKSDNCIFDNPFGQQYYCRLDCTASWKENCKKPCWNIVGDEDELQKCVYKCEEWNWEYLECAKAFQPLSYAEAAATLPMCYIDEGDVTYYVVEMAHPCAVESEKTCYSSQVTLNIPGPDAKVVNSFIGHVCEVICNKSIKGSENCDFDNDGLLNYEDDDPYDAFNEEGGGNTDYDSDGVANLMDNCMDVANTEQFDSDNDGTGDACEETPQEGGSLPLFAGGEDSDGDGTPDGYDDAPSDPLVANDTDGDGIDNENKEDDIDGDGVYDWDEAATCAYCKYDPNESQDSDGDGIGNNLESKLFSLSTGKSLSQETNDNDGDGIQDGFDTDKDGLSDGKEIVVQYDKKTGKVIYYQLFDPTMVDTDYNGLPDPIEYNNGCDMGLFEEAYYGDVDLDGQANCYDSDADGDGIANKLELAGGPFANVATLKDLFKTDPKSSDTDGDKVNDGVDNCPTIYNTDQKDTDKVLLYGLYALGNACDLDDDDDGTLDEADCAPTTKWVGPTMSEYCNNKVDDNCNGQFDENCFGDYDGDDLIDSEDDCPYIPSKKGEGQLCAEYPHFIPSYHTNIDDINNDGCMCAYCINNEDCNPGFKCIDGKCQVGPDYVNYKELYHECCLICNFDNDCGELKIWKAQYPEPAPEEPSTPPAEPEQPPQPDQGTGGDTAGDDKPMLPAGKGPVPPSDRVAKPEPSVRPVDVQPAKEKPIEDKPADRLPAQPPPAPLIVDWDGDGVVPKDNCPCVPNPDQDPNSMLVKFCKSMDYCKNMADYTEAKIACIGEDCSEKPCAPGMRCSGDKCITWPNYGWSHVASLYHGCCSEETSETCKDGKIWIAQYQSGSDPDDIDGDGILNENDGDIDGDMLANECENNDVIDAVYKTDSYKYDSDGDSIKDGEDNCPNIFNPNQKNTAFELCMAGKIHPIPSKFEISQEINGEKTGVLVDETTYCSELSAKVENLCDKQILIVEGNKMCENGKISLTAWCKAIERLGNACEYIGTISK